MALLPFLVELWLQCTLVVLIWLVAPIILVAKQKMGAATVVSILVALCWVIASILLFSASAQKYSPSRDGQTWVSLLWLTSAVGALSSIAFSTVLLLVIRNNRQAKKAIE